MFYPKQLKGEMLINYLETYGPKLIAQGYDIIPLLHAKKFPGGVPGWQNLRMKPEDILPYIARGYTGVGILSKNCPAIDLDIRDRELTLWMIKQINDLIGESPYRVGQKPKALLPFKVQNPFRKLSSKIFHDPEGNKHQVEILGDGGQWVSFAIHPDTQEEYKWSKSIVDIPRSELPTLGVHDAKEIIQIFEKECERRGWLVAGKSEPDTAAPKDVDQPHSTSKERLELSSVKIKKYLASIDPAGKDYTERLKVGMSIHHETAGSDEGFGMWDEWLQRSPDYDDNVATQADKGSTLRYKWDSFTSNGEAEHTSTFRSVIKEANAAGTVEDDSKLAEFLKRFVYVATDDTVHDLWSPQEVENLPLKNFNTKMRKHSMVVEFPTKKVDENGATIWDEKSVTVADQWLKHVDRQDVQGMIYAPGRNAVRVIERHGHKYLNSYRAPVFERPVDGDYTLLPFRLHMDYMFPDEQEREWFLSWMALNVQHPENRCKVTPLHVSVREGTGRGWMIELMNELLGSWNCRSVKIEEVTDAKFNAFLANSLLIFVDEVYEQGAGKFKVMDKIRATLTENQIEINEKNVKARKRDIHANFFLMTNHPDALSISDTDRRINVLWCDADPLLLPEGGEGYFDALYGWKKSRENVAALYFWLLERDLSGFKWQRSFKGKSRERLIDNSMSDVERAFLDVLRAPKWPVMTLEKVAEQMAEESGDEWLAADRKVESQIKKLLQKNCESLGEQVRVGGRGSKKVRPWILHRDTSSDKICHDGVLKIIQEQYSV